MVHLSNKLAYFYVWSLHLNSSAVARTNEIVSCNIIYNCKILLLGSVYWKQEYKKIKINKNTDLMINIKYRD